MSYVGKRRLEVCGHGARPTVPVDIHAGGASGHRRHHPAGAHAVRRPRAHRQALQPDSQLHAGALPAARVARDPVPLTRVLFDDTDIFYILKIVVLINRKILSDMPLKLFFF